CHLDRGPITTGILRSYVRPARSARSKSPSARAVPRHSRTPSARDIVLLGGACPYSGRCSLPAGTDHRMSRYRITVDTGGTFSDFVYLNEETGELSIAKLPSTPDDPSRAILVGIEALLATAGEAADIGYFCHGTTVGTNALLEGKGVRTGLLVTEGIGRIEPAGEEEGADGPPNSGVHADHAGP